MFQWKKEYNIDGCVIDHEHQHLFELANRVLAFEDPVLQLEAVQEAISNAFSYVEYHFSHEEELMREADYPGYEDHVQKHKDILGEMNSILNRCYDIQRFMDEFKQLMTQWVVSHIIEEDTKIAPYVKTIEAIEN